MAIFAYQARDTKGDSVNGVVTAGDINEATRQLRNQGNTVVDIHEQADGVDRAAGSPTAKQRARRDDVISFANQLAVMVDTGVPLTEALDSIADQATSEKFTPVLTDISERVKGGAEFSSALARYPRIFDDLFVAMVRASEASGTMGQMLQRVAKYLQKQRIVRKQVKGALAYPLAMLGFCVLVVIGMLVFILPRFEKIYAGKEAALPGPTKFLLALSSAMVNYWHVIIVVTAAATIGAWRYFRSPSGRTALDTFKLQMPILGTMFRRSSMARSLRTFAAMIATGVNVLEALEITASVAGNSRYSAIWQELCEKVKEGATLSDEMFNYDLIPRSITQMIAAGERAGKLGTVLDRLATFCEDDLDISVKAVTSFIEPVMIIIMGGVVGGISMALLLPVFTISKVVGQ